MTEVIGYAALQVIPSLDGIGGQLTSQLVQPMTAAGRQAGRDAGRAVASGLQSAQAEVARASAALAAARDKEADAAGKVRVAETKLEELRASGRASASQIARAEEALESARRRSARASETLQAATQDVSDARARLANTTDEAEASESRFSRAISNLTGRLGPAEAKMAAVAAATAGIGVAMAAAGQEIQNAALNDKLAAQLGAPAEMAAEFGGIAGRLYADAYGENLGEVNEALRNVWQQGLVNEDATTAEIEGVTASVLNLATAFDQDVNQAAAAVGTMLKTGLAPDAQSAMDVLTRGFQQGADKGGDLLDSFTEYSVQFKAMGLDAADTAGLMAQALGGGARNADLVVDALKEFTLQIQGGGEATRKAISDLGFSDVDAVLARFAKGGDEAQAVFTELQSGLVAVEDPAKRAEIALGLYGTKFEDLQSAIFAMDPSTATQALGNIDGAATQMGDTLRDNTATAIEQVKRGIQSGLGDALGSAAQWMLDNKTVAIGLGIGLGTLATALVAAKVAAMGYAVAQGVMAAASGAGAAALAGNTIALGAYTIATGVIRGATLAWSAVQWVLNAALTANPIGAVVLVIAALVAGIVLAWKNSETFRAVVTAAWEGIKTAALWTWDNVLKPVFGWIIDNYKKAWDAAKAAGEGIGAAWQWISDKATDAKDWIVNTWNTVVDFVTGLPGRVRDAASGLWDSIKDSFRSAINWLISAWNNFSLGFDFKIPVINQQVSFRVDTPDLPLLAGGGVAGRTKAGALWGPGTGTSDSILGLDGRGFPTALVSSGEGVVTAAAMANGGAALVAALNAGWVPSAALLHAMLPGFAAGGLVDAQNFARGAAGKPYQYGGVGDPSWDCSGLQSDIYAVLTGKPTGTRHFTTETDFEALGFVPGMGGPFDYSIGVMRGGGGPNSHMAGTLGDLNVESSGTDGVEVGPGAQGAADFPLQWHLPLGGDPGGMQSPGGALGGVGGSAGGSAPSLGGGAGTGGAGATGGATGSRPSGAAVPVWVDNWPSTFGTATTSTPAAFDSAGNPVVGGSPAAPAALGVGGKGVDQHYGTAAAGGEGQSDWGDWAKGGVDGFRKYLEGNWKEMLNSALAVAGMGASGQGGGNTFNLIGPDPRQAAMAIERVQRRMTMAARRSGGFGR